MNKKTQVFISILITICFAPLCAKLFVERILEPTQIDSLLNVIVLVGFCAVFFFVSLFLMSFREYLNRDKNDENSEEPAK